MISRFGLDNLARHAVLVLGMVVLALLIGSGRTAPASSQSPPDEADKITYLPRVLWKFWEASYQMPPLSQNPLLMRAYLSDGSTVDYFGSRSDDGIPIALESASVLQQGEAVPTSIAISGNRPEEIFVGDGSRFEINWINDSNIEIKATTSNNKYQVTVPVDLDNPAPSLSPDDQFAPLSATGEQCKIVEPASESSNNGLHSASPSADTPTETVAVALRQCQQPFDSNDLVRVRYESDELGIIHFNANRTGPGMYETEIPVYDPSDNTPIGDICVGVVDAMGATCTALSGINPAAIHSICTAVGAAIDVVAGGPTGEGAAIYAACLSGFRAATIYCQTLGEGPFPGGPSLADRICEEVGLLELPSDEITLQPYFFIPQQGQSGAFVYSDRLTFPSTGPFSTLRIEVEPNLNLPLPSLYFNEHRLNNDETEVYYVLGVSNAYAYPQTMFAAAPSLPPCGDNHNSSRTWLYIYDRNDNYVYGYCVTTLSWRLPDNFGIVRPWGVAPPSPLYIKLIDRACGLVYESNLISLSHP